MVDVLYEKNCDYLEVLFRKKIVMVFYDYVEVMCVNYV